MARIATRDDRAGLELAVEIELMPESSRLRVELTNVALDRYDLDELTMTVPVPERADELAHFVGRWAHEFQLERVSWPEGAVSFDNRRGRTSHDRMPVLLAGTSGFDENCGSVWGFALGWSGNAVCGAELLTDGRRVVRVGELLAPGDVVLDSHETYTSPWIEIAASERGLNGVSQALHASIRSHPVTPGVDRPRPVILNTWEAVYFDHDLETLTALADRGARVGIERFVLDDGWFHGRRSDDAGLGDWWIDQTLSLIHI